LLGGYSVETIFNDAELMRATAALVFCASDFVGAWGARELLAAHDVKIDVMSGPVTDSQMGADYVREHLGIPAANAVNHGEQLALIVKEKVARWKGHD
jgi:hypothetical protein